MSSRCEDRRIKYYAQLWDSIKDFELYNFICKEDYLIIKTLKMKICNILNTLF